MTYHSVRRSHRNHRTCSSRRRQPSCRPHRKKRGGRPGARQCRVWLGIAYRHHTEAPELEVARRLDNLTSEALNLFPCALGRKADVERVDARGAVLLQRLEDLLRRADEPALRPADRPWCVGVIMRQLVLTM